MKTPLQQNSRGRNLPGTAEISMLANLLFFFLEMRWLHLPLEVPSGEKSG